MQFINPQFWWLGLLAIIPVVLYLFRRRSKTFQVSTLVFFKSLAKEHQESAWLRRLKRILSLLLTLLLLLGAVSALTRIVFSPVTDTRNVVILLDRSASMQVKDENGQSRLEAGKALIRNRLEGLSDSVGVSLIVYDSRSEILMPRTLKRRALLSALDEVNVRPVSQNEDAALDAAKILAKLEIPSEIWHVSDQPASLETQLPEGVNLVGLPVSLEQTTNVGITAFQIRKLPLQASRYTAFLQVMCNESAPETVEGMIEVRVGGVYLAPRSFELEPGKTVGFEIPIDGAEEQLLQLQVSAEGDSLALDNSILVPLPESRPIVVARFAKDPDPYTHLALQSLVKEGELNIWSASPDQWPLEDVDVVLFENWLPEEWPKDVPAIILNPPGGSDSPQLRLGPLYVNRLRSGIPYRDIRVANEDHPLLFRVSSSRIALTQTSVFDISGSLEPLWFAGAEPVLAAGTVEGQRMVLMGFSPQMSERLPFTASFPILIGNAIYWCAEGGKGEAERFQSRKTGDVVVVSGETLNWTQLVDGKMSGGSDPIRQGLVELERTGVWESDSGQRGSSHLLSRAETNVPTVSSEAEESTIEARRSQRLLLGEVTWLILAIVLGVLLIESVLFHWFAVY